MENSAIHMAMEIRDNVMIMAYPIVLFAAVLMFYRGQLQSHGKMIQSIVFIGIIVCCMRIYPSATLGATDYVTLSSSSVSKQIEQGLDSWSKTKIEGEDSTFNFSAKFTKVMYKGSIALSSIMRSFLIFMQRVALYVLIALSPILLALMLIQETSSISVKFIMTTIAIILWGVGFNISDMMIYSGWDAIMHAALNSPAEIAALGGTGIAGTLVPLASISTSLPVLTIGLAFMIAFYFLIGTMVFNVLGIILIMKLLHGGDPISATMQAITSSSSLANGAVNSVRMGQQIMGKKGDTPGQSTGAHKIVGGLSKIGKGLGNIKLF
jgi:hypothetical protein